MSKSANKKSIRHPNRSKTVVFGGHDNLTKKLYAMTVDKYFSSVPDKDERFRPYTKEEEKSIIRKYRKDRPTLEKLLTEHNIFFALNYASTQAYRFTDYDELISLAMNGLRVAATTFDPKKGYRFNTWIPFYLKNFILRKFYVKKEKEIENNTEIYLDSNISTTSDENASDYMYSTLNSKVDSSIEEKINGTFIDEIEKEEHDCRMKMIFQQIVQSVETSSLSTIDKKVFNKSFIEGCSICDISKQLNKSKNSIAESKSRVLEYITTRFPKESVFSG